jgi:hypothetical protein
MMNECNHGWMIWITAGIPMAEPALFAQMTRMTWMTNG